MRRILCGLMVAVLLILGLSPSADAVTPSSGCSAQVAAFTGPSPARPVIYVHGWLGTGPGSQKAVDALQSRLGSGYTVVAFDYTKANQVWGAAGNTKACLADFIKGASTAFTQGGGDGKVLAVGHSMGGIVIRAADGVLAASGQAGMLGGVVTLATPLQGSPWGGTGYADFIQWLHNLGGSNTALQLPDAGTSAVTCLAAPLPASCEKFPYLSTGTKYATVGSQIIVQRQLFGLSTMAADIPLFGDTIVPQLSANGYVKSSAGSFDSSGFVGESIIKCQYTAGYLSQNMIKLGPGFGLSPFSIFTILEEFLDQRALDTMMAGKADASQFPLVIRGMISPCSHTGLPTYGPAVDAVAGDLKKMGAPGSGSVPTDGGTSAAGEPGWFSLKDVGPATWENGFDSRAQLSIKNTKFPDSIQGYYATGPRFGEPDHAEWALKGKCSKLEVWVGQDADSPGHTGPSHFAVTLDNNVAAERDANFLDEAQKIELDLTGVTRMEFQDERTNLGGAYNVWGSPRIYCSENPKPKR
ncbi:alpha/beta fold hydrolase [Paeniglutamicibacter antarcticus]|uniref:Alpha/beta fold hydrolase n=1 Tax=Arthrobacter terrae TaxID=2935737 RepID=A0A931G4K8_9MICC|nr:alpha/beta fold hydrolase [Arthrobacter terrae]MBG0738913.1 alpha/beta fold hydrolase [Arthrobacter terrae]